MRFEHGRGTVWWPPGRDYGWCGSRLRTVRRACEEIWVRRPASPSHVGRPDAGGATIKRLSQRPRRASFLSPALNGFFPDRDAKPAADLRDRSHASSAQVPGAPAGYGRDARSEVVSGLGRAGERTLPQGRGGLEAHQEGGEPRVGEVKLEGLREPRRSPGRTGPRRSAPAAGIGPGAPGAWTRPSPRWMQGRGRHSSSL